MSADNFHASLVLTLKSEGGDDDDPHDHGGRTSRGITQREFDRYCEAHSLPHTDVWTASDAVVANIYYDGYWLPNCDDLPRGLDYVYFDTAVNAGPRQATRSLQTAIGVAVDGAFGPKTAAAAKAADARRAISDMSEVRRRFYRNLPQFPRYGKGWLSRVDFCERHALAMLGG